MEAMLSPKWFFDDNTMGYSGFANWPEVNAIRRA